MPKPLRWGILSTGRIAHTFARDLALIDEGVITAVGSRTMDAANSFADEFEIAHRHDSYESLVADPEVDVIYVGTPHPFHHDNAMLALRHGKHVLVEKSFTMTGDEARDLVRFSRERGLFLMEAMWTRFLPHVVAIRELIGDGALGDIVCVEADHGKWFEPNPASRLFAPELGGGALLDLGVYPVSFASMILGTPTRVSALVEPAVTGVDAQTSMLFGYANGAHAVLTCGSNALSATRASVVGVKARIEVDGDFYAPTTFTLITRGGERRRFEFESRGRGLHYQASEVARCIAAGLLESPVMPLDESVSIMETMEEVLTFL